MLDAGSLAVLGSHFERLMGAISSKVDSVSPRFFVQTLPTSLLSSAAMVGAAR